jgi:hypothetical protein
MYVWYTLAKVQRQSPAKQGTRRCHPCLPKLRHTPLPRLPHFTTKKTRKPIQAPIFAQLGGDGRRE